MPKNDKQKPKMTRRMCLDAVNNIFKREGEREKKTIKIITRLFTYYIHLKQIRKNGDLLLLFVGFCFSCHMSRVHCENNE